MTAIYPNDPARTEFRQRLERVMDRMAEAGYPMTMVSRTRSAEQQGKLYAKGRTSPGEVVTEADGVTKKSHHQVGTGADLAFVIGGKPSFSPKLPWDLYGKIAEEEGLTWGGRWKTLVDRPHVQYGESLPGEMQPMPVPGVGGPPMAEVAPPTSQKPQAASFSHPTPTPAPPPTEAPPPSSAPPSPIGAAPTPTASEQEAPAPMGMATAPPPPSLSPTLSPMPSVKLAPEVKASAEHGAPKLIPDPIMKVRNNQTGKIIKFQWHDKTRQPTQEDFAQIFEAANRAPMAGPLGEAGRSGNYNPMGAGTEEFSTTGAAMRLPKQWADTTLTAVGEEAYPASLALMGRFDQAREADNKIAETSDLSVDSMGGVSAPPVEDTVTRNLPGLAPAVGKAAMGPLGLLANDQLAESVGAPIVKTGIGMISDPTTYVAFHKGPALIRKGAALLFGAQAAKGGMLALGEAYQKVRAGDMNGAASALTSAGVDGLMATLMLAQLRGGASPAKVLADAEQIKIQHETNTGAMPAMDVNARVPLEPGPLGPGAVSSSSPGGVREVPAPEPVPFQGAASNSGAMPQEAVPTGASGMTPTRASSSGSYPVQMEMRPMPPPVAEAPLAGQEMPPQTRGMNLQGGPFPQGAPPVETTKSGEPGYREPASRSHEEEYAKVRAKGKRLKITNGDPSKSSDARVKEPPYDFNELRGLDPQYDTSPPEIGSPEWWKNNERGALAIGPSRQRLAASARMQARKGKGAKAFDQVIEGRRSMLLSAPTTYVKQAVDLASQAEAPGLKTISAGLEGSGLSQRLEQGIQKLYGKANTQLRTSVERHIEELPEHFKAFWDSTGMADAPGGHQDAWARAVDVFNEKPYQLAPHMDPHAIPGKVGKAIRTAQRIVGAVDTMMKELTSGTEQASYAVRNVKARGLTGALAASEIRRIRATPFEHLPEAAQKEIFERVQEKTLTESLGSWGRTLNSLRERPIMKFLFPFMQVGSNIAKQTYQRTPLYLGEIIHKVGTGQLKGGRVADEFAKPIMGAVMGTAFLTLAKSGFLTGSGPNSRQQQYNKQAGGWQPYSVHAGGQFISYDALGHVGSIAGLAADYAETSDMKKRKDIAQKMFNSIITNLTPRTIQDMGTIFELAKGWRDGQFERSFNRFAGTTLSGAVIPRIVSKYAAASDSDAEGRGISRKVESIGDYVMRDVPGQREKLPILRSSTGKPVLRDSSPAERFFLPFPRTEERPDRIAEHEFERLGWIPRGTTKTTGVRTRMGLESVELTPEERESLLDSNAKATKVAERVMQSAGYKRLNDRPLIQKEIIERIYTQHRKAVLARMQRSLHGRAPSLNPGADED